MKLDIYMIGKTKDSWIEEGMEEYAKRLSQYALLNVEVLKESKHPERSQVQKEEGETLKKRISEHGTSILLDPAGTLMNSERFAEEVIKPAKSHGALLQLFIAGAYGLAEEDKQAFDMRLSFSPMTFTHQMMRPLLLEQLYRATTIVIGKQYHY